MKSSTCRSRGYRRDLNQRSNRLRINQNPKSIDFEPAGPPKTGRPSIASAPWTGTLSLLARATFTLPTPPPHHYRRPPPPFSATVVRHRQFTNGMPDSPPAHCQLLLSPSPSPAPSLPSVASCLLRPCSPTLPSLVKTLPNLPIAGTAPRPELSMVPLPSSSSFHQSPICHCCCLQSRSLPLPSSSKSRHLPSPKTLTPPTAASPSSSPVVIFPSGYPHLPKLPILPTFFSVPHLSIACTSVHAASPPVLRSHRAIFTHVVPPPPQPVPSPSHLRLETHQDPDAASLPKPPDNASTASSILPITPSCPEHLRPSSADLIHHCHQATNPSHLPI